MIKSLLLFIVLFASYSVFSQNVGINVADPDASAALEIKSLNTGLLVPRMTTAQRIAIASPANGLMVFDTDTKSFWFRETTNWVELSSSTGQKSVNGSASFTTYNINPKRYMWELNGSHPVGTSIALPQTIIDDLCADEDGCKVNITMTNYAASVTESASISVHFFYTTAAGGRRWRASNDNVGVDGNSSVEHIISLFSNFYFTDASYASSSGADTVVGLNFMKWSAYPVSTIGRLIIED